MAYRLPPLNPPVPPPKPSIPSIQPIQLINASHNFESEVIKALGVLFETETDYNVIVYIGEKQNFKEFHAHSGFLRCRSDYFNKILSAKSSTILP